MGLLAYTKECAMGKEGLIVLLWQHNLRQSSCTARIQLGGYDMAT